MPASALLTPSAGLAPEIETLELLSAAHPELSLAALLSKLDAEARLDGRFFLCNQEQLVGTAHVLGQVCEWCAQFFGVCTHIHVTHVTYVIIHIAFQLTGHLYLAISSLSQVKGLTLQDQFLLVNAPIDAAEPRQRRAFVNFVRHYASGRPVLLSPSVMPPGPPRSESEMGEAEDLHKARRLLHVGGLV
jgi:Suv3 C-terminal domain 1